MLESIKALKPSKASKVGKKSKTHQYTFHLIIFIHIFFGDKILKYEKLGWERKNSLRKYSIQFSLSQPKL